MKNKTITIQQINAHWAKVIGSEEQILAVWEILSYEKMVRLKWKSHPEKMTFSFLNRKGNKFPYGLVSYVTDKLNEKGYEVEIQEIDFKLKTNLFPKVNDIKWEDYQRKVLKKIGNKNKRGIIVAPTAAGKTVISAGIISRLNIPITLFVTINKTIFHQTVKDFEKWFPDIEIGRIGDGICDVSHITVALYQSLSRFDLKKYSQILELLISDEVHSAGKSIGKILGQLNKTYYRYGLSATPHKIKNDKQKYFEMVGNIGPIIEELEDDVVKSRVVDCDAYMITYVCDKPEGHNYHSVFRQDICCSEKRNNKLLKAAKMLALDKGKSVLFLVDEISQAELVKHLAEVMGIKCRVAHGKNKTGLNEKIKSALNDKKIKLVVATAVFKTGMNLPSLDCLVLGSARKSEISYMQAIGRARRSFEGKDKAIIIDSFDIIKGNKKFHNYFSEYSEGRLELYKSKGWFKKKLLI